jgi:hypothetical protein
MELSKYFPEVFLTIRKKVVSFWDSRAALKALDENDVAYGAGKLIITPGWDEGREPSANPPVASQKSGRDISPTRNTKKDDRRYDGGGRSRDRDRDSDRDRYSDRNRDKNDRGYNNQPYQQQSYLPKSQPPQLNLLGKYLILYRYSRSKPITQSELWTASKHSS